MKERDAMPSKVLDMRDCVSPAFSSIHNEISRVANKLQPVWFRPFFRILPIKHRLEFDHWSRKWEYPWALLNANLQAGMRVLDVGSGGSPFPLYLGIKGFECYAADPSLDQGNPKQNWRRSFISFFGITAAWGCPPHRRSLPVRYCRDSIQKLSFSDDFFDGVFCLSVMEHVPQSEWSLCMEQLSRVVKSGGRLLLTLDMLTPGANARVYKRLISACPLDLIGNVDYTVPIPDEDKRLRHLGHTYETIGLVWKKR